MFRKSVSPIISTALILFVSVIATVQFHTWFNTFSNSVFTDVQESSSNYDLKIEGIIGNKLYLKSLDEQNLNYYRITNSDGEEICTFEKYSDPETLLNLDLDEGVGNTSRGSVNGHIANLYNDTQWISGVSGYGLEFNSSKQTYLEIIENSSLWASGDGVTYSAWIYRYPTITIPGYQTIIYNGDWYNQLFIQDNGTLTASFSISGSQREITSDEVVPANFWHHIASVYNGSHINLYLDADLIENSSYPGLVNPGIWENYIGSEYKGESAFNGKIDNVQIINKSLNSDELKRLMQGENIKLEEGINELDMNCDLQTGSKYYVNVITDKNVARGTVIKR